MTSDAGLLAYRELDVALDLTQAAASELQDLLTGKYARHSLSSQLRQSIYSRLAGNEDLIDAETMATANRLVVIRTVYRMGRLAARPTAPRLQVSTGPLDARIKQMLPS